MIPYSVAHEDITHGDEFHIYFDVTYTCVIIQINFFPREYSKKDPKMFIHFRYNRTVRISYTRSFQKILVHGHYTPTLAIYYDFDIIGDIKYITVNVDRWCINRPLIIFSVLRPVCIHRCSSLYPGFAEFGAHDICDMCQYRWLDGSTRNNVFYTIPGQTLTLERLLGTRPINLWDYGTGCRGTFTLNYVSNGLKIYFQDIRDILLVIDNGQYWRYNTGALSTEICGATECPEYTMQTTLLNWGQYMYFICHGAVMSPLHWDIGCKKYGASQLTITDHQELHFLVKNVMRPFQIDSVYMGMKRRVSGI